MECTTLSNRQSKLLARNRIERNPKIDFAKQFIKTLAGAGRDHDCLGCILPGGFTELAFIGGGAKSDLWCQTLADVLGCTIRQVDQPVLANAHGAALIAAIGIGDLTWSEVPSRIRIAASYEPDPGRAAIYDRQYRTFSALYRKNRGIYATLNR